VPEKQRQAKSRDPARKRPEDPRSPTSRRARRQAEAAARAALAVEIAGVPAEDAERLMPTEEP